MSCYFLLVTINYTNTTGKQKAYTFIIFTYFQEQLFILSFQNEAVQFDYILALGFSEDVTFSKNNALLQDWNSPPKMFAIHMSLSAP